MNKPFDIGNIFKQAQGIRDQWTKMEESARERRVSASSGGGMVTATVNGKMEVLELKIDPQLIEAGDQAMLQDLVVAAVNQAIRRAQELMQEEMSKLTGGLKIPGLG